MSPEQDKDGVWFITLPDGERKEFKTNAEAWGWVDRHERRECGSVVADNGVCRRHTRCRRANRTGVFTQ